LNSPPTAAEGARPKNWMSFAIAPLERWRRLQLIYATSFPGASGLERERKASPRFVSVYPNNEGKPEGKNFFCGKRENPQRWKKRIVSAPAEQTIGGARGAQHGQNADTADANAGGYRNKEAEDWESNPKDSALRPLRTNGISKKADHFEFGRR